MSDINRVLPISRRVFLATSTAGWVAGPWLSRLSAEPIAAERAAPARPVLQPLPRKRIQAIPDELLKLVDPEVRYRRVELPAEKNALPILQSAIQKHLTFNAFLSLPPYNLRTTFDAPLYQQYEVFEKGGELPGADAGLAIGKWVEANQPVVDLVDRALGRGQLQYPLDHLLNFTSDLWAQREPLRNLAGLIRFLAVRIRFLLVDRPAAVALAAVDQLLRLGRMLASADGLLVHCLTGLSAQRQALAIICDVARSGSLTAAAAAELLQALPRHDVSRESFKQTYRVEFCYYEIAELEQLSATPLADLIDTYIVRHMYYALEVDQLKGTAASDDDLRQVRNGLRTILRDHPQPFDKAASVRIASAVAAESIRNFDRKRSERRRDVAAGIKREIAAWPSYLSPTGAPHSQLPALPSTPAPTEPQLEAARNALVKVENPLGKRLAVNDDNVDLAGNLLDLNCTRFAATQLVLACSLRVARHGRLPDQLDDLVREKLIDAIPIDPFSDRPFQYSRDRAIIWSVGTDEKDDQGDWDFNAEPPHGKDLAWRLPQAHSKTK